MDETRPSSPSNYCFHCQTHDHNSSTCTAITCKLCHKSGHIALECTKDDDNAILPPTPNNDNSPPVVKLSIRSVSEITKLVNVGDSTPTLSDTPSREECPLKSPSPSSSIERNIKSKSRSPPRKTCPLKYQNADRSQHRPARRSPSPNDRRRERRRSPRASRSSKKITREEKITGEITNAQKKTISISEKTISISKEAISISKEAISISEKITIKKKVAISHY